jgi:uncharacterized protein YndB with AHSA1/START domain
MHSKNRITLERTYDASIEDVWDLWTTKDGIESWWGPEGFSVTVRELDLRAGGKLLYTMTAVAPPMIEFMKKSGMPIATEATITYVEIAPKKLLSYVHLADFIPGVAPYDVETVVEIEQAPNGVRMVLSFDPMHDEQWTNRAVMGWESELGKLERALKNKARS